MIVFPFERGGRIVNRKFRHTAEKKWAQDKGGESIFWRHEVIGDPGLEGQPLIITEGEMDCVAAIQAGYWHSVGYAAGAPQKPIEGESAKYDCIEKAQKALDPIKEIIIAADGDEAGAALLSDFTRLLRPARCRFVTYPPGCKDLNDVLLKHGVEGVRDCIDNAAWVRAPGVFKLSELPPLPPLIIWRPTLHPALDEQLAICPGHVSVWTGYAGDGKSTLVNACMWSIAEKYGFGIAAGSFEATPQREYLNDAIAFRCQRPFSQLSAEEVAEATRWVEDHIIFLNGDGYGKPGQEEWLDATFDWFLDSVRTSVIRHGCRIAVLDPWSQIDHEMDSREREDLYVRRIFKQAKMFARAYDAHIAIVAHPKNPNRNRDGTYDVPDGYSVSGGAHWKNAPDLGITAFRDPPMEKNDDGEWVPVPNSTRTLVRPWKKKSHRLMGKPQDVYVDLDCHTGRYHPTSTWEDSKHFGKGRG